MKKLIAATLLIMASSLATASEGEAIYKNVCSQCHADGVGNKR